MSMDKVEVSQPNRTTIKIVEANHGFHRPETKPEAIPLEPLLPALINSPFVRPKLHTRKGSGGTTATGRLKSWKKADIAYAEPPGRKPATRSDRRTISQLHRSGEAGTTKSRHYDCHKPKEILPPLQCSTILIRASQCRVDTKHTISQRRSGGDQRHESQFAVDKNKISERIISGCQKLQQPSKEKVSINYLPSEHQTIHKLVDTSMLTPLSFKATTNKGTAIVLSTKSGTNISKSNNLCYNQDRSQSAEAKQQIFSSISSRSKPELTEEHFTDKEIKISCGKHRETRDQIVYKKEGEESASKQMIPLPVDCVSPCYTLVPPVPGDKSPFSTLEELGKHNTIMLSSSARRPKDPLLQKLEYRFEPRLQTFQMLCTPVRQANKIKRVDDTLKYQQATGKAYKGTVPTDMPIIHRPVDSPNMELKDSLYKEDSLSSPNREAPNLKVYSRFGDLKLNKREFVSSSDNELSASTCVPGDTRKHFESLHGEDEFSVINEGGRVLNKKSQNDDLKLGSSTEVGNTDNDSIKPFPSRYCVLGDVSGITAKRKQVDKREQIKSLHGEDNSSGPKYGPSSKETSKYIDHTLTNTGLLSTTIAKDSLEISSSTCLSEIVDEVNKVDTKESLKFRTDGDSPSSTLIKEDQNTMTIRINTNVVQAGSSHLEKLRSKPGILESDDKNELAHIQKRDTRNDNVNRCLSQTNVLPSFSDNKVIEECNRKRVVSNHNILVEESQSRVKFDQRNSTTKTLMTSSSVSTEKNRTNLSLGENKSEIKSSAHDNRHNDELFDKRITMSKSGFNNNNVEKGKIDEEDIDRIKKVGEIYTNEESQGNDRVLCRKDCKTSSDTGCQKSQRVDKSPVIVSPPRKVSTPNENAVLNLADVEIESSSHQINRNMTERDALRNHDDALADSSSGKTCRDGLGDKHSQQISCVQNKLEEDSSTRLQVINEEAISKSIHPEKDNPAGYSSVLRKDDSTMDHPESRVVHHSGGDVPSLNQLRNGLDPGRTLSAEAFDRAYQNICAARMMGNLIYNKSASILDRLYRNMRNVAYSGEMTDQFYITFLNSDEAQKLEQETEHFVEGLNTVFLNLHRIWTAEDAFVRCCDDMVYTISGKNVSSDQREQEKDDDDDGYGVAEGGGT